MPELSKPWAVAEELTRKDYQARIADNAVDVYTDGKRFFRVFNYNEGAVPAPDTRTFDDRGLTVLTDPELVLKMATHFRARFTGAAAA